MNMKQIEHMAKDGYSLESIKLTAHVMDNIERQKKMSKSKQKE